MIDINEFLTQPKEESEVSPPPEILTENAEGAGENEVSADDSATENFVDEVELDVQKAVVQSLAADKAEQNEIIANLRKENYSLKIQISTLKDKIQEMKSTLDKIGDLLAANSEGSASNKVALLDRDIEINDRFPGETYDQVLEVIKEAREKAEKDGRIRLAQLLEGVMLVNEPTGNLAKKRAALEKFFHENHNILSGPVIEELEKCGIAYKKGEEYLLISEILKRTY